MCEVARSTMVKYMHTHVHIYPCLIFLWEINAVIKIRKNELITLQMDNQLGPEDCREHVLCWYSIWFRGFSWGNWYFIHTFLEIICSNLLALSVCKMYFFKKLFWNFTWNLPKFHFEPCRLMLWQCVHISVFSSWWPTNSANAEQLSTDL